MLVSPWPGKVLAARGDAFALQAADDGGAEPRDVVGLLGERAIADDRVLRIGVDVEHRRVVERDADRPAARPPARARTARPAATSPLRPSVAIGGHSVNGAFRRATRPPS